MAPDTIVCVALDSGPCYGRILPPRADTPEDHLRVDLAGIVHLVPAPFASRPVSTDECAPEVARLDRVLGPLRTIGVGR